MLPIYKRILVGTALLPLYPAYLWSVGKIGGNVHEVVSGQLYRSAQLTGRSLEETLSEHRIASVINLRGGHVGEEFYDDETGICRRRGIAHLDIGMSSRRMPKPAELSALLSAFDRLPRPVLVHCRAGADRTGLAVTLYRVIYQGWALDRAQADGLSWHYGHTGMGKAVAMDRFVDLYRETGKGRPLRDWIVADYPKLFKIRGGKPAKAPTERNVPLITEIRRNEFSTHT